MASQFTHADALREYLTGAGSDGGAQADPLLSLGHFRSSTEAASLGIALANAISGVTVDFAGASNGEGAGLLTAVNSTQLTWTPPGANVPGAPVSFPAGSSVQLLEGATPGQYLRATATPPFTPGVSTVTLTFLANSVFSVADLSIADALAGVTDYRGTVVKNVSAGQVTSFKRWLGQLGTAAVTSGGVLPGAGQGTVTGPAGAFATWPDAGWCRLETSGGVLREIVYYSSRTDSALAVTSDGRARLGSAASAGAVTDNAYAVPGIAVAADSAGVQAAGSSIQTLADGHTAPAGVTWKTGIRPADGLSLGTLNPGQLAGLWLKREVPPNYGATPGALVLIEDSFNAY